MTDASTRPAHLALVVPAGQPTAREAFVAEPWAALLRRRRDEARERLAAELLDLARIRELVSDAAARGLSFVRVAQAVPVSLQHTKAAQDLEARLRDEGFIIAWVRVTRGLDDKAIREAYGEVMEYEELRLAW